MIRRMIILCIMAWTLTLVHTGAFAGYRELMNTYDAYGPPAYFQDQFRAPPEPKDSVIDRDFAAEKKRIEEIKSRWEASLKFPGDEPLFLRPEPELLKSLKPAQTDSAVTAEALKGEYSLKVLETLALLRNPGIKAAENRLRGAVEAFTQIAALDEILREYTAFTEGLMVGVGPMKGKDPVAMKFPFPGVLSLKGQVVNQEVRVQRENLEAERRNAVTAIRKAYWNIVYVVKAERITAEMLELLKYLEEVANTRYEAGRTSYQDVIKVRINREILEEDLITLRERQRNLESKIREILNLSPNIKVGAPKLALPPVQVPSLLSLYNIARERRQELRRLRAMVGKMERMIEMAETMILPPYTLNLSLFEDESVDMVGSSAKKEPFPVKTEAARGAGLPKMPWYGTEDAYLRETRQRLYALREELKKAEAVTNTMVRNAWFELDRDRRERFLYHDEVVQLSRSALDVSTSGYTAGTVTFADVIDSYTTWLRANLTLERTRSDSGIARADLE